MMDETMTVETSALGVIPEGTELEITRDHTNQFTGRRVITAELSPNPTEHVGSVQFYQMPDETGWTEIHVGLSRDHEHITLE